MSLANIRNRLVAAQEKVSADSVLPLLEILAVTASKTASAATYFLAPVVSPT